MIISELVAIMRRPKRTRPTPPNNSNSQKNQGKNLVIANLIPFTTLNMAFALGFVLNALIKALNPTQIGMPKLSIHVTVMMVLLVWSNSDARSHFKRRLASWRGQDFVEVIDLQPLPNRRGQATDQQPISPTTIHLPNQIEVNLV